MTHNLLLFILFMTCAVEGVFLVTQHVTIRDLRATGFRALKPPRFPTRCPACGTDLTEHVPR